jgi:hypothetical protein
MVTVSAMTCLPGLQINIEDRISALFVSHRGRLLRVKPRFASSHPNKFLGEFSRMCRTRILGAWEHVTMVGGLPDTFTCQASVAVLPYWQQTSLWKNVMEWPLDFLLCIISWWLLYCEGYKQPVGPWLNSVSLILYNLWNELKKN